MTTSTALTPEEYVALLQDEKANVECETWRTWRSAGEPPGIRPEEDFYGVAWHAIFEAALEAKVSGNNRSMTQKAKVMRIRNAVMDEIRRLQVGVVVRVNEDGHRFPKVVVPGSADSPVNLSLSVHNLDREARKAAMAAARTLGSATQNFLHGFEDAGDYGAGKGVPAVVKKLQKRMARDDGKDGTAAKMDYDKAISMIGCYVDEVLLMELDMIQTTGWWDESVLFGGLGSRFRYMFEWMRDRWTFYESRAKRPERERAVAILLETDRRPNEEILARLARAATWIEGYCNGRSLGSYPRLPKSPSVEPECCDLDREAWAIDVMDAAFGGHPLPQEMEEIREELIQAGRDEAHAEALEGVS